MTGIFDSLSNMVTLYDLFSISRLRASKPTVPDAPVSRIFFLDIVMLIVGSAVIADISYNSIIRPRMRVSLFVVCCRLCLIAVRK